MVVFLQVVGFIVVSGLILYLLSRFVSTVVWVVVGVLLFAVLMGYVTVNFVSPDFTQDLGSLISVGLEIIFRPVVAFFSGHYF